MLDTLEKTRKTKVNHTILETKISSLSNIILTLKSKKTFSEKLFNTITSLSQFAQIEKSIFLKYNEAERSLSQLTNQLIFSNFSPDFSNNLIKALDPVNRVDSPVYIETPSAYISELPWHNLLPVETLLVIPVVYETKLFGYIICKSSSMQLQVSQLDKHILQSIAFQIALMMQNQDLKIKSETDFLSKLKNRGTFEKDISQYAKDNFSLIMFDIDNFKLINDNYGHAVGDRVIQSIKTILKEVGVNTNYAYRIGGEEFALIIRNENTREIANNIRLNFKNSNIIENQRVTISLGYGSYKPSEKLSQFLRLIDQAMYQSKKAGRDKISLAI